MKIEYLEEQSAIKIDDNQKQSNQLLTLVVTLNLLTGILNLWRVDYSSIALLDWIWLALTPLNLVLVFLFIFKRSTQSLIMLDQIAGYKEHNYFGQKIISLKLKNGKKRSLNWQGPKENVKDLLEQLNIKPI